MSLLAAVSEWLYANRESAAFLAYWLCLLLFAVFEGALPAFAAPQHRRQRWPTNLGIGILNIGLFMIAPLTAVMAAHWAATHGIGLLNMMSLPFWLVALATVLLRSFAGYVFHVLLHKVGLFWRIHRIHHSDTHLDVSTGLRNHPLEVVALVSFNAAAAILFGLDPWVLAAVELIEPITNIFAHANIRLPERIDRPLRWLFVTPNMHCLHHSSWQPETDSNYGQILSVWDRLFGTYSAAPRGGYDAMRIGLDEVDFAHASDIVWQMKLPALDIAAAARNKKPLTPEGEKA